MLKWGQRTMPKVYFDESVIFYQKYGEGIPIVLIHPPGLGGVVFQNQLELADYYQLLIPDLSGHGDSTAPLASNQVDQYANEIRAIIQHECLPKAVLCAYSAGGTIAQYFVRKYPELVDALIISGAYPNVSTASLDILKVSPIFLAKRLAASNTNTKYQEKRLLKHIRKSSVEHWYAYYLSTYHYDVTKFIDNINCPSLFIYGNLSDFTHGYQNYYLDQKHIEVAFVENAAHQIPPKKYQAFNHLVKQFIDRLV